MTVEFVLHLTIITHNIAAVADLGIGDMGSRPGRHLAVGGIGRPHPKKSGMVAFARSVFYRSFAHHVDDIMSPCGTVGHVTLSVWAP